MQEVKVKIDQVADARKAKRNTLAQLSILDIIKNCQLDQPSPFCREIDKVIDDFEKLLHENENAWIRKFVHKTRKKELNLLIGDGYNKVERSEGVYKFYDDRPLIQFCYDYKKNYENLTILYSAYNDLPKQVIRILTLHEQGLLPSSDADAIVVVEYKIRQQEKEVLRKEVQDIQAQLSDAQTQLSAAEVKIEEYRQGKDLLESMEKISQLQGRIQKLEIDRERLQAQVDEIKLAGTDVFLAAENRRLIEQVVDLKDALTKVSDEKSQWINKVDTLQKSHDQALEKLSTLEEGKKQDQKNISDLQTQMKVVMEKFRQLKKENQQQQQNQGGSEKDYRNLKGGKNMHSNPHVFHKNNNNNGNSNDRDPRAPNFDDLTNTFNNFSQQRN